MTKKVALLLATVLCLPVKYAFSQKAGDYIATDSSLSTGIKLEPSLPRFNSQYITLKMKNGSKKYTPDEIREYGFKDGTVFETQKILLENQERKVFLERLVKGTITLYMYVDSEHRTYYIKKDSADLVELGEDLEAIRSVSQDCEFMSDALRLASYKRKSLQKLASHYNTCERKPFPYKRFGFLAGWRQMTLAQPSSFANTDIGDISIPSSGSPMVGIFADLPIQMSEFSLHSELFFTTNDKIKPTR